MRTDALDYHLPAELIATRPAEPRDSARMLVARRVGGHWSSEHRHVRDLPAFLTLDDLLVFNVSRVLPARLEGKRANTGGRVEGLFLGESGLGLWRVMLRSNGRLHPGDVIELGKGVRVTLDEREHDFWRVRVEPALSAAHVLEEVGWTPLPPYIMKARGEAQIADESDRLWYQTVYAALDRPGSVAAPTAGLHFTPDLLKRVDAMGVARAEVVLHVGAGTFKPVTAPTLAEHPMHEELYSIPAATIDAIRRVRSTESGRVIAIGTTTVRTLESAAQQVLGATGCEPSGSGAIEGRTRLLIAPPYEFKVVDAMLTNFHLPRSTLLALVAAMVGRTAWRSLYDEAIRNQYRFYSYGDAMLILP